MTLPHVPDEIYLHTLLFIYDDDKSWSNCRLACQQLNQVVTNYRYQTITLTEGNKQAKHVMYQRAPGEYYLEVNPKTNFSKYAVPTRNKGKRDGPKVAQDVVTTWRRIRVDINNLMVNTGDFTFSKSVGFFSHHKGHEEHVPYGTCFDCEAPQSQSGSAVIDLRGTPFSVKSDFVHGGYLSAGNWQYAENRQLVTLKGGGFCGWVCTTITPDEPSAGAGGWFLELQLV